MKEDATPPPLPSSAQPSVMRRLNLHWPIAIFVLMVMAVWAGITNRDPAAFTLIWLIPSILGFVVGLIVRLFWKQPYVGPAVALVLGSFLWFSLWSGQLIARQKLESFQRELVKITTYLGADLEKLEAHDPSQRVGEPSFRATIAQMRRVRRLEERCVELLSTLEDAESLERRVIARSGGRAGARFIFEDFLDSKNVRRKRRILRAWIKILAADQQRLSILVAAPSLWSVSPEREVEFSPSVRSQVVRRFENATAELELAEAELQKLRELYGSSRL